MTTGSLSSIFGGGNLRPPRVIVNSTSTTGSAADTLSLTSLGSAKRTTSGALTANTLVTVISITGAGVLEFAGCEGIDATSRTHRFKVTIDGVVAYDATTAAVAAVSRGIVLVGSFMPGAGVFSTSLVPFNTSLLIEYASSLSETAKTNFGYIYRTY